jgi:anthranilate synthase component I
VGASPEMLVRLEEGVVETRPIAGTRPRGETLELDRELEVELSNDPKERAEHTMLVELGKSDLERVSISGSVEVPVFMSCDRYSHVMHLVSEVKGRLREDKDAFDALLACFPAGTVSGAPRAEAMEIIDQLEPTKRGPYAGAVGYVSFAGNMDTCITIRTIVFVNGKAYAQAGAGIVTDSQPEREYEETLNKAQVLLEALKIAGEDSENDSYRSDRFYSVTK